MTRTTAEFHLVTEDIFLGPIACMNCKKELPVGSPFGERLEAIVRDIPMVSVVCVYCAVAATVGDERRPA